MRRGLVLLALVLVGLVAACGDDDYNQDLGQGCNGCDLSVVDLTGKD
jgi:hypothetical protein